MKVLYLDHFGLKEAPFSLTPNTEFFLNAQGHHEALNVLILGLENCDAFIKVTGEVGTGKTLLCRKFMRSLSKKYYPMYMKNLCSSESDVFFSVGKLLGITGLSKKSRVEAVQCIEEKLIAIHKKGRRCILVVDEAQTLSPRALEALRLLTNIETETDKMLQVILFGQPELNFRIESPQLRQLKQRIVFSYELKPMTLPALSLYLRHRLSVAGYSGPNLFSDKALEALYKGSEGFPRVVNILAHKALIATFGESAHTVTEQHVHRAILDTDSAHQAPLSFWMKWLTPSHALALGVLAVSGVGLFGFGNVLF